MAGAKLSTSLTHPENQERFLELLAGTCYGHVQDALRGVGVTIQTAYRERKADPEFAKRWDEAMRIGKQGRLAFMEASVFRMAYVGYAVPVLKPGASFEFQPNPDAEAVTTQDEAVQAAFTSKNIADWKFIPPNPNLAWKLLAAADRGTYDPPKAILNANLNGIEDLKQAIEALAAEKGVEVKPYEIQDALLDIIWRAQRKKFPVQMRDAEVAEPGTDTVREREPDVDV